MEQLLSFADELDDVTLQLTAQQPAAETAMLDSAQATQLSQYIHEEYQRLSMASLLLELPQLQAMIDEIDAKVHAFTPNLPEANAELLLAGLLTDWLAISAQVIRDPEQTELLVALHKALTQDDWPEPLNEDKITALLISLRTSNTTQSTDAQPALDQALSWDQDIHPELLETWLQETPQQVEDVGELIQLIAKRQASVQQRQQANRLAHTLKGSSAILGVTPMVKLAHKLEDILGFEIDTDLTNGKDALLSASGDLLVMLFEHLLAKQNLPEQYPTLIQQLDAWHQQLKANPPTADSNTSITTSEPEVSELPALMPDFITLGDTRDISSSDTFAQDTFIEPGNDSQLSHLNIAVDTLQHLLNLAGEAITSNTRLHAMLQQNNQFLKQSQQHEEQIQNLFDELEESIEQQNNERGTALSDLELEQYHNLYSTYGLLAESITDARELSMQLRQSTREMHNQLQQQKQLQYKLSEEILHTRMLPVQSIVNRLERTVRETARSTNKQVEISITGTELLLDGDILTALTAPLLHMLRNAIDHGIESPTQRKDKQKQAVGQLRLSFKQALGRTHVDLHDDGQGFDTQRIFDQAVERGLIKKGQLIDEQSILNLTLLPGFSTRETVSETSGRGIGMDVVTHTLRRLRGHIQLNHQPGKGSHLHIEIPQALITTQAVIAQTQSQSLAIPAENQPTLVLVTAAQQRINDAQQWQALHEQQWLDIYPLDVLLGWAPQDNSKVSHKQQNLLLVHTPQTSCFIHAKQIQSTQEIVIKGLKHWQGLSQFIHGASILADGTIAPVLDIPRLLRHAETSASHDTPSIRVQQPAVHPDKAQILVVDDSLSNRKAVSQMLEQMKLEAITARDGQHGLSLLRENTVQLVITDLEMPNMNGLEMTRAIRLWTEKQGLPVIMLTSRSTQKHRQLAQEAGVSAYLTKPVNYHTLSNTLQDLLPATKSP